MPYEWNVAPDAEAIRKLTIWPYNSLPPRGFAGFILATFALSTIPLYGLLGTVLLWGLLPFLLTALAGLYYALRRNARDRQVFEELTITSEQVRLTRRNPRSETQNWECNVYWARVQMHPRGGPVPNYVTLKGAGREVEIGAFLSEDERKTLYDDLRGELQQMRNQGA